MKPVFDPSRFSNSIDSESRWNSPRVFTRAGIQGFLIFLIGILLSGCVDYQQSMPILPMGASPNEVQTIIGPPKSKSRDGSLSTWNYGDGAVCVFKEGKLVASNLSSPSQYSSYVSSGVTLPPVSVNVVPAVYPPAVYYGGGWGGWGLGWGYPWGGYYGWGGYGRPYYGNYWRYNNCRGNYYRGNYYRGNGNHNSHH